MVNTMEVKIVPVKQQFVKLMLGAIAGFAATQLVVKGFDAFIESQTEEDDSTED